jgi:hypothetical protein
VLGFRHLPAVRAKPAKYLQKRTPIPEVILSGQKNHLKRSENRQSTTIGVALNALDDPKAGIEFINTVAS